jgi:hypothetical protein
VGAALVVAGRGALVVAGRGGVATAAPEKPPVVVGTIFFEFFAIVGLLIA